MDNDSPEFSQGVCQDGAAILKDGQMVTIEEILAHLRYHHRLREALEEVTATLAWLAHGECRAIHEGPIMPSAQAQEVARALLAELNNLENDHE